MMITTLVFVSSGRSSPAVDRPDSGRRWLEAYGGRCAVTPALTLPRRWKAPTCALTGDPSQITLPTGCCLRADIHTLFDLGLLAPDPVTRIITVSKLLAGTQYELLSNSRLADPVEAWQRPIQEALEITWQRFREAEGDR